MMKKALSIIVFAFATFSAANTFAATPSSISFAAKKSSMFGGTYHVYRVKCSDGRRTKISAWGNKKTWCKGTSKRGCFKSQLKAAAAACR